MKVFKILIVLIFISSTSLFAQGSIKVTANPPDISANAGFQFEIIISVGDPNSVNNFVGVSFNLEWDSDVLLNLISSNVGPFLGGNPLVIDQKFDHHIEVGVTSTSGGKSGSGEIYRCTFELVNNITHALTFDLTSIVALNGSGNSITLTPNTPAVVTDVKEENLSFNYSLSQNYPNPFNPLTTIEFEVPEESTVSLKVYDIKGSEVSNIFENRIFAQGRHSIDASGKELSSGIYLYVINASSTIGKKTFSKSKKMILLK